MSMGSKEGFKEYAQKWRDLAGRVQPPLTDREMVDMFMGTLTGPFFNLLIRSSSSGFTEMVLIGERIENGIRSGKILMDASSSAEKKPFGGKMEANVVHGQKGRNKDDYYFAKSLRASCSFEFSVVISFACSNTYLLMSNFVSLMHCICLS